MPTCDEEATIGACIDDLAGFADQVFIVDSGSRDRTRKIGETAGATVVEHVFERDCDPKGWALRTLPIRNEWVLFLYADEQLTRELRAELSLALDRADVHGYWISYRLRFMGTLLLHGGFPAWVLRLVRRTSATFEARSVNADAIVRGKTARLLSPLLHDDGKGLAPWFDRCNRDTTLEAADSLRRERDGNQGSLCGTQAERKRWISQHIFRYLPLRPVVLFVYVYFVRLGFLDGRGGLRYALLRAFVRYCTDLKIAELRASS